MKKDIETNTVPQKATDKNQVQTNLGEQSINKQVAIRIFKGSVEWQGDLEAWRQD